MPGVIQKDLSTISLFWFDIGVGFMNDNMDSIFMGGFTSCYRNKRM